VEVLMERIHKTNMKVIKYPLIDIRKGLQKKYRGTDYRLNRTRTKLRYRPGSYRGVEYLISRYN
tara:strand:+ start:36 stop:227 length:192 start_codon:yes stop_codon:yes gene_type:complete